MALGPYFRAVVDSLDFFLQRDDPTRVVAMVRMLQAHAQMYRGLLFITVSTDGLSLNIKQELSSIADMVLSFQVRTIGSDFETSMMVSKFRNAPENLKILVFRGSKFESTPIHLNPNMDNQQKYRSLEESNFFADGSTMKRRESVKIP